MNCLPSTCTMMAPWVWARVNMPQPAKCRIQPVHKAQAYQLPFPTDTRYFKDMMEAPLLLPPKAPVPTGKQSWNAGMRRQEEVSEGGPWGPGMKRVLLRSPSLRTHDRWWARQGRLGAAKQCDLQDCGPLEEPRRKEKLHLLNTDCEPGIRIYALPNYHCILQILN